MTAERTAEKSHRKVACAKCGHLNSSGANQCLGCSARLYISCRKCGHSNLRSITNCSECGQRLHRSFWRRLQKRVFGANPKITPFQILLLIAFVLIAYKGIVFLAEYKAPAYQGE